MRACVRGKPSVRNKILEHLPRLPVGLWGCGFTFLYIYMLTGEVGMVTMVFIMVFIMVIWWL